MDFLHGKLQIYGMQALYVLYKTSLNISPYGMLRGRPQSSSCNKNARSIFAKALPSRPLSASSQSSSRNMTYTDPNDLNKPGSASSAGYNYNTGLYMHDCVFHHFNNLYMRDCGFSVVLFH